MENQKSHSKLKYYIFFLLALVVISIFLCELIIRLWGYSDIYMYDPIYRPYPMCNEINYVLKSSLKNARGPTNTFFNTDQLGLRAMTSGEKIPPKQKDDYRIMVIGDSVTFGQGIPTEGTFCSIMEKDLAGRGNRRIKTYNYGVPAYSILEFISTLEYRAVEIQPDLVLICVIYDDFNLNRRCKLDRWGYLSGTIKESWLSDSIIKKWLRRIHLSFFLRNLILAENLINIRKIDYFPDRFMPSLDKLKQLSEDSSYKISVVLLPDVHPFNMEELGILAGLLKQRGMDVLDLSFISREFNRAQFTCHPRDPHPSEAVHHRVGEEIAHYLIQHGFIPDSVHLTDHSRSDRIGVTRSTPVLNPGS